MGKTDKARKSMNGLSAAVLKNTAVILMFVNHFAIYWYQRFVSGKDLFFRAQWYITRPAFFLFAFLVTEGMVHTRDRRKYILWLFATALISEPVCDALKGAIPYWGFQNVLFTLGCSALAIYIAEKHPVVRALPLVTALAAAFVTCVCRFDYGVLGVGSVMIFYYMRKNKKWMLVVSAMAIVALSFAQASISFIQKGSYPIKLDKCVTSMIVEAHGLLALPMIAAYNGKKGRQLPKLFYYAFYPAHLLLILILVRISA